MLMSLHANPRRTKRLTKSAVAVAARLVAFSLLSPIGAAAHHEYVRTIAASATSMSDERVAEAVTYDRNKAMAAQRSNCVGPEAA
jgi:hypothetical protein